MPKREKERPMPALKRVQTKSGDLTEALESMLKEARKLDSETGKSYEIIVQEVVPKQGNLTDKVSEEQQRLLDKFMDIVPSKGSGKAVDILRGQREEAGQFNSGMGGVKKSQQ